MEIIYCKNIFELPQQFRPFHNYPPLVRCRSCGYSFFHKEGECPICSICVWRCHTALFVLCTLTKTLPCFCHPERSKTAVSRIRSFAQSKGSSFIKVSAQPTAFLFTGLPRVVFTFLASSPHPSHKCAAAGPNFRQGVKTPSQ